MKKTLFITSALAVLAAAPAMAADPEPYMNNTTHQNSCVESVLGVTEGTAHGTPEYTARVYSCDAGDNLKAANTWTENYASNAAGACEETEAGYYSAGFTNHTFTDADNTTPFGKTQCPANYASSDAGSDAVTDCYRECTLADVGGAAGHASTFSGRYYANSTGTGDGVNECAITACVDGYTLTGSGTSATCVAKSITLTWEDASGNEIDVSGTAAATCTYDGTVTTPASEPVKKGYTFEGWNLAPVVGNNG